MYPCNKKMRKAYKKQQCKANRRAWKKRNDNGAWIIL